MKRMNSLHFVQIAMRVANARTCVLHVIRIVRQLFNGQQLADSGIQPEFFVGIEAVGRYHCGAATSTEIAGLIL